MSLIHTCSVCGETFLAGVWQSKCPKCRKFPGLLIIVACLMLAACGGGGSNGGPVNSQGAAVISSVGPGSCTAAEPFSACGPNGQQVCAPNYSGTYPNCTLTQTVCPVDGYPGGTGCSTCPAGTVLQSGQCQIPAPILICAVGGDPDNNGCICPAGTSAVGTPPACVLPPTACSSDSYGTPPNCLPIPSCSAVIGGYWGGNACECPAFDTGTYPTCTQPVAPPTCPAVPGAYWGGNACECPPAPWLGTYPNCILPSAISFHVTASANPTTVADDGGASGQGCTPQNSCTTVNFAVTSNYAQDTARCVDPSGNTLFLGFPVTIGPFSQAQDGPQFYTVTCVDSEGLSSTATVSFTVVPVAVIVPPVPDTLACASGVDSGGNPDSVCQYTSGVQGDECYVYDESASSGPYALNSAGQGAAAGTVLGPQLFGPTTFGLACTLTVGPQVTVTP